MQRDVVVVLRERDPQRDAPVRIGRVPLLAAPIEMVHQFVEVAVADRMRRSRRDDLEIVDRDHFVVATKYTLFTRQGDPNACGNHRKNMARALEASLKRLKTDYIDLYWVHAWDFMTPVEEVMRGLDDMVRAGKVLYVGISDTPAWIVSQANTLAHVHGWSPFVGLQVEYSLAQREPERDLLPMARAFDIGVTAWSPLAGGILSGKYAKGTKTNSETARFSGEDNPPDDAAANRRDRNAVGK